MNKTLISYAKRGDWSGYTLEQRPDGYWRYESSSRIQGCPSGRVAVLEAPPDLTVDDEADLDTLYTAWVIKAEYLRVYGKEIRCLRRGYIVR